jgi:hypothetical protein
LVFTPGYFTDGAGQNFAPRQAAVEIAAAASVPVYGPYNTFIGTGVVGGRVRTFLIGTDGGAHRQSAAGLTTGR